MHDYFATVDKGNLTSGRSGQISNELDAVSLSSVIFFFPAV